jgi:hypothetical protein
VPLKVEAPEDELMEEKTEKPFEKVEKHEYERESVEKRRVEKSRSRSRDREHR